MNTLVDTPPGAHRELRLDPTQILTLSNRVVEFHHLEQPAAHGSWRWHVEHLAVEAKPRKDGGLKLKIGLRRGDGVWAQAAASVPPEKVDEATRFFETAKREAGR